MLFSRHKEEEERPRCSGGVAGGGQSRGVRWAVEQGWKGELVMQKLQGLGRRAVLAAPKGGGRG